MRIVFLPNLKLYLIDYKSYFLDIYQDVGDMVPDDKNVVVIRLPSAKEEDKCPC